MRFLVVLLTLLLLPACGDSGTTNAKADASDGTSGTPGDDTGDDTGPEDTGTEDTGTEDTGTEDTGTEDTGPVTFPEAPDELGGDRPATYVLPDQYDEADSWPLLLLLHGYGANAGQPAISGGVLQDAYLGLSKRSSELGFIMLLPHGTPAPNGNQFWNATPACCDFANTGVDDVGYLTGLLDEAASYFNIDPKRVYLLGHSNGGFMSYRLACQHGDRFAAMLSIAGSTFNTETECSPGTAKLSVAQVHGTDDGTIPYAGEPGKYPGAIEAGRRWADRNGCTGDSTALDPIDIVSGENGAETQIQAWGTCEDDTEVQVWTLDTIGHIPAFNDDFSATALEWLLSKSRP